MIIITEGRLYLSIHQPFSKVHIISIEKPLLFQIYKQVSACH